MNTLDNELNHSKENALNYNNEFISLSLKIATIGKQINTTIRPFSNPKLPHFSKLDIDQKNSVLNSLKCYLRICESCIADGHEVSNPKSLLWYAMKELGLKPCSDFFNFLTDDDVVEIYGVDNMQIFRNFKFFELCSYSIEDIYCRPWTELFLRPDDNITAQLVEFIQTAFKNNVKQTLPMNYGSHSLYELDSVNKNCIKNEVKYFSPIYDNSHRPYAYIAIERAELTNDIRPSAQVIQLSPMSI